jgi:predicted nuclease of restriction endonuclease-like (RecB) superfamily
MTRKDDLRMNTDEIKSVDTVDMPGGSEQSKEIDTGQAALPTGTHNTLFDRVASILDQARANVVRMVNNQMVIAYWLIGREIVQEVQRGEERAEYGKQVIEKLSKQLTNRYESGFSVTNLQYCRKFYQVYFNRMAIQHPLGVEFMATDTSSGISRPLGAEFADGLSVRNMTQNFSSQLSWSHYRALMRVGKPEARDFYEQEAIACGWNKRTLERQIHSFYYERMLKSQNPQKMLQSARQEIEPHEPATETLKNPYVLEFLGLPDVATLHETQLESAIITHLQSFLLELGRGFAFVARQKRMRFEDTDLYVDLVFYNCILKCYLLIDLKMGEISHQDVGQMDSYVRLFDDLCTAADDNPTIGLILCTDRYLFGGYATA